MEEKFGFGPPVPYTTGPRRSGSVGLQVDHDGQMVGWPDSVSGAGAGEAGADRVADRFVAWPPHEDVVETAARPGAVGQVWVP